MRSFRIFLALALATLSGAAPALNYVDSAYLAKIGKNWIKNAGAEQSRAGWVTYADAAGTAPVDCTGGSPTATWTVTSTNPLAEAYSFLWTHPASNVQGNGASYQFSIDRSEQGRQQQISLDYEVASGTFAAGVIPIGGATAVDSDLEVYVYDVTNATLIYPSNYRLLQNGGQAKYTGTFQTASNSQSYRLCLHAATTSAVAHTVKVDSVKVGPLIVSGDVGTVGAQYDQNASSSNTSVASSATAIVDFNSKTRDDASLVTTGSSWKFTAVFPGWYQVSTALKFTPASGFAAGDQINLYAYKNGAQGPLMGVFVSYGSGSGHFGVSGATLVYLNAGDYLDVRLNNNATPSVNFDKLGSVSVMKQGAAVQAGDDTRMIGFEASTATATITGSNSDISWTKIRDDIGGFNGTTTWTASAPGWYYIDAAIRIDGTFSAGNDAEIAINVGGSDKYFALTRAGGAQLSLFPHISKATYLNAGDTVKMRVASAGSSLTSGANTQYSWWTIAKWPGAAQLTAADTISARYTSTSTASISGSDAIINYDTLDWDTTGAVATGASWKFTASIPGKYRVSAAAETSNTACTSTSSHFTLSVYKNGARHATIDDRICSITGGYRKTVEGSTVVKMVPGDYVDVRISDGDATTHSLATFATDAITAVQIDRVGN
jgi:hypothetical protein